MGRCKMNSSNQTLIFIALCLCSNIFVVFAKPSQSDARIQLQDCDSQPAAGSVDCLPAINKNQVSQAAKSFVTTTSDAIYRALSNVFTYEPADAEASKLIAQSHQQYNPIRQAALLSYEKRKPPKQVNTTSSTLKQLGNSTTLAPINPAKIDPTTTRRHLSSPSTTTEATILSTPTRPSALATTTTTTTTAESAHLDYDDNGGSLAAENSSTKMDELLDEALRSIFSLKATILRNRTTRLAPPHFADLKLVDLFEASGSSNGSDQQHLATREDVHLLCKLLHKRLESSASNRSSSQTLSTSTPMSAHKEGFYVASLRDLNETLDRYLLESLFLLLPVDGNKTAASSLADQERAELGLLSLFNEGLNSRKSPGRSLVLLENDKGADYDSEPEVESRIPKSPNFRSSSSSSSSTQGPFVIKSWSSTKTNKVNGGATLRLVYWLLERQNISGHHNFRLLDEREALGLLDVLEFPLVERHLESVHLKPVRDLVGAYRRDRQTKRPEVEEQPLVLDDSLSQEGVGRGGQQDMKPKSSLQMLLDRFSESSFVDNLHLYLVLFILVLVLIIVCVAVPMICCNISASASASARGAKKGPALARAGRRRRANDHSQANRNLPGDQSVACISGSKSTNLLLPADESQQQQQDYRDQSLAKLQQQSDAIWRKLSNTTTTLIKDESVVVRNDGTVEARLSLDDHYERRQRRPADDQLLDWHPFGSGEPAERRTHKSVQTNESRLLRQHHQRQQAAEAQTEAGAGAGAGAEAGDLETRPMTLQSSRSNTMSKSELVMLKEKMIPIMREAKRQQATQTSLEQPATKVNVGDHDYVNQSQMAAVLSERQSRQTASASSNDEPNNLRDSQRKTQLEDGISSMPSRHIDSASESRSSGVDRRIRGQQQEREQRQPTLRRLELPANTRSQVEAIRSELEKLEQRDPAATYKRYDVI